MKKLLVLLVLLAVALCSTSAIAQDADERGYINLSAFGSWMFNQTDDANDDFYVGGRATYDITPHIELGVESGWASLDVESGSGVDLGEVDYIPLLGIIVLKYPLEATDNKLVPYVLGGAGGVFWDSEADLGGVQSDDGVDFAWKAGGGADYYFTETMAVFAEGGYSSWTGDEHIGGTVDNVYVAGGLKFSL